MRFHVFSRILVLDDGKLAEMDSPDELVKKVNWKLKCMNMIIWFFSKKITYLYIRRMVSSRVSGIVTRRAIAALGLQKIYVNMPRNKLCFQ